MASKKEEDTNLKKIIDNIRVLGIDMILYIQQR